jgi:predicted ArsR family transcriptional regulator
MARQILELLVLRGALERRQIAEALRARPNEVGRQMNLLFRRGLVSFRPGVGWVATPAGRAALRGEGVENG